MKTYGILCFVLAVSMLVCPLCSLDYSSFSFDNIKNTMTDRAKTPGDAKAEDAAAEDADGNLVTIKSAFSGNTMRATELAYIIGCVAAEIPASYHDEAIKAQAVAAYTNLQRLKKNPDSTLGGADISDNPATHQGYYDEAAQKEKWGEHYDTYHEKIENNVREVLGQAVVYNGEPIIAAYSAICPGRSESAANIWGGDVPYLQSVISTGDKLSPDYQSTVTLTAEQFREAVLQVDAEAVLSETHSEWIGDMTVSANNTGVVLSVVIGGKSFTGLQARAMFGLRSPSFQINCTESGFDFKVAGYGHGVGMSQYGADYMARQGSTYREILAHYYPGTEII